MHNIIVKMRINTLLLTIIPFLSCSILIPLSPHKPRCMVVYTVGESDSVKFDIIFPQLSKQQQSESFQISIINTQNSLTIFSEDISNGKFKREMNLQANIIYDVCIALNSQRSLRDIYVQYQAENLYVAKLDNIKVPQHLLKKEDFKQGYEQALNLQSLTHLFSQLHQERSVDEDAIYVETKNLQDRLITISMVQLVVIVLAGLYQFFAIKKYLSTEQEM